MNVAHYYLSMFMDIWVVSQSRPTLNNAVMNTVVYVLRCIHLSILLGNIQELLCHGMYICLALEYIDK